MNRDDFKCRMCGACCRIKDGIVRGANAFYCLPLYFALGFAMNVEFARSEESQRRGYVGFSKSIRCISS